MTTATPTPPSSIPDHKLPSLLEDPAALAPADAPSTSDGTRKSILGGAIEGVQVWVREHKRTAAAVAFAAGIAVGVSLFLALRPVPQPDFLEDDFDLGLNYALLTADFNSLPLAERDEIFKDILSRLKNMPAGDSVLMARFAETLNAKARAQFMENMSKYMIDTWDTYAVEYDHVPADERADYLDETFVAFTKKFEGIAGEESNKTDEQRLAEVNRQAERDRKNVESGRFNPPAQALGRAFEFMNFEVGGHASPQQRSRGQLMMRDMMRHFRGSDVNGEGKPAAPSSGPR